MRQEIQGLRAVAVLLVVLFHLWPDRLPGGYVGVDVFFVISGFLITAHLLREVDRDGSVDLARFWARRMRRLLPASYLVLLVSAVGVLLWVPRLLWQQFFGEVLAAALYVENWALAINAVDYLAADNTPSPAQHYWTLSAEEQFYLVWPLLVLLGVWWARRRRQLGAVDGGSRRAVLGVLAVATVASLAYSLWVTATNPPGPTSSPRRAPGSSARGHCSRSLLLRDGWGSRRGLVVCSAGSAWSSAVVLRWLSTSRPRSRGRQPCGSSPAAVVLIWVEAPGLGWSHARLLVLRPARFLGDISYSVYLWHWPLIILLPFVTDHALTRVDKVGILVATIALVSRHQALGRGPGTPGAPLRDGALPDHLRVRRGHRAGPDGRLCRPTSRGGPADRADRADGRAPGSRRTPLLRCRVAGPGDQGLPQPRTGGPGRAESLRRGPRLPAVRKVQRAAARGTAPPVPVR